MTRQTAYRSRSECLKSGSHDLATDFEASTLAAAMTLHKEYLRYVQCVQQTSSAAANDFLINHLLENIGSVFSCRLSTAVVL